MKITSILFFIVLTSCNLSIAQTVSINCVSASCLFVNPEESISYSDIITGIIPQGYSISTTSWEATPTSDRYNLLGASSSLFSVTWMNKNNSTPKKVKVTVVFSNGTPSQNITKSDEKTVVVKYIGAIASMTLSGDVSATPANNSTLSILCGVQSLTISVPTPATDPNVGVTYTWLLPSGWSGSSTSNTINTTTNAGQTNGTISVIAGRTDGTFTQSYSVNVTRPLVSTPTLTGVPTASICIGSYFYLIGNTTNATSYNWSTTGALSNTFSADNFAEILTTSGTSGTVTFTVDNACQSPQSVTRTIYVGPPAITSATVDWQPLAYPNYINNPGFLTINVNNAEGSSTNWTLLNGSGNIYYAGQNQVSVYAYPFMRVEGVTSNQCGTGEARTFYVQDISNGYYRMVSPNPTTSIISSEILAMEALKKVTLVSAAHPGIVRMYNANGSLNADTHRNNNLLSFDIGNLPRGLYYLNFFFEGNRNFTEQIQLN